MERQNILLSQIKIICDAAQFSQILYVILQLDFYLGYFVTSWYDKQAN